MTNSKKTMTILIVYQNVPEETDVYVCNVTDSEWSWMQKTHGTYCNTSELDEDVADAHEKLSKWLDSKKNRSRIVKLKEADNVGRPISVSKYVLSHILITGFVM